MGSLPRPKITAWVHGGVAARGSLHPCSWPPVALQKSLHGCAGSLQRRTRCASLQLAPVAHQPLLHGHTGALQSGTRCIPAAVAAVTHCTIKCCCMGAWWCLVMGLVAFQQLLHTKSCCMDAQCHCSTAPAAPQYPLHPNTHCIPVPIAASAHCTPILTAPSIHYTPKVVAQMGVVIAAPIASGTHCMATLLQCTNNHCIPLCSCAIAL